MLATTHTNIRFFDHPPFNAIGFVSNGEFNYYEARVLITYIKQASKVRSNMHTQLQYCSLILLHCVTKQH